MKFDAHIVEVIDKLHDADLQLQTLTLIRDFAIRTIVGRATREICAFLLDHFFLASPFTLKLTWFGWNTNQIEWRVIHFLSESCSDLMVYKKIV